MDFGEWSGKLITTRATAHLGGHPVSNFMACLAFFFLCRPGKYTAPTGNNAPFCLEHVTIYVGNRRVLAPVATEDDLT
jgi:hypothetical protein